MIKPKYLPLTNGNWILSSSGQDLPCLGALETGLRVVRLTGFMKKGGGANDYQVRKPFCSIQLRKLYRQTGRYIDTAKMDVGVGLDYFLLFYIEVGKGSQFRSCPIDLFPQRAEFFFGKRASLARSDRSKLGAFSWLIPGLIQGSLPQLDQCSISY